MTGCVSSVWHSWRFASPHCRPQIFPSAKPKLINILLSFPEENTETDSAEPPSVWWHQLLCRTLSHPVSVWSLWLFLSAVWDALCSGVNVHVCLWCVCCVIMHVSLHEWVWSFPVSRVYTVSNKSYSYEIKCVPISLSYVNMYKIWLFHKLPWLSKILIISKQIFFI